MLKYIISILILISIQFRGISQNVEYFSISNDSVNFYISCNGSITINKNATYRRVARLEKERLAFYGEVCDYFKNGSIALKAFCERGFYDGLFSTYYPNGNIKEKGKYLNNNRDSIWCFYYNNGGIEKRIDYRNKQVKLIEYYKKNGNPVFIDGNGSYKGQSNIDYNSCKYNPIGGEVRNGLMDGRWTINLGYSRSTEIFEDGKFIRGHESPQERIYESNSMISLSGYPYYENISLLHFQFWCDKEGLFFPEYNNTIFADSFLNDLRKSIKESKINKYNSFFYALMEFKLENGKINEKSFKSVTNDSLVSDRLKLVILSLDKWNRPTNEASFTIYLPVFWVNENIYLRPDDIRQFN